MPTDSNMTLALTPRQAADALNISEKSLYRLTRRGVIPCLRLGNLKRYQVSAVEAALGRLSAASTEGGSE